MSNKTLDEVLTEYDKADKLSRKDPDSVPAATRPGFEISIRRAKDALPGLRAQYTSLIMKNSIGLFLQGEEANVQKFMTAAVIEGAIHLNAGELFEKLVDVIQPTMGGRREFSVTQVGLLDNTLRELCEKAGHKAPLNRTNLTNLRVVQSRAKLVDYVRQLVFENNGNIPSLTAGQSTITMKALKKQFKDRRLVVVVTGAGSQDRGAIASLFTKSTNLSVDPPQGEEVDARFARERIMQVLRPTSAAPAQVPGEQNPPANQTEQNQQEQP